jgi:two-component system sensor histidine kinase YesM
MVRIGKLSMQMKLAILVLGFVCIPFLVSGMIWYEKSTQSIENNAIHYSRQIVEQINDNLDSYFVELGTITSPVLTSPLVNQFLNSKNADTYDMYLMKRRVENELFLSILSVRTDIINLSIVSDDGLIVSSYEDRGSLEAFSEYKGKRTTNRTFKNFNIEGVRKVNSSNVLTITRDLRDISKNKIRAMLIIDVNYKVIPRLLENVKLGNSDLIWAMDSENRIIYHPDEQLWGKYVNEAVPTYAGLQGEEKDGFYIDQSSGKKKLIIYDDLKSTGWVFVDELPLEELIGSLMNLRYLTLAIGIILVVLVLIAVGTFTLPLTRSLLLLQKLMRKAEDGNLDVRAPEHKGKEIGSLFGSFNNMVTEIKRLIEVVHMAELKNKEMEVKQMESSLLILQSQINPHFLYNTLEVVNSYAIEAGVRPISKMLTSIAKMFRYNVGNPQKTVTLLEEIEHIQTYLSVQIERYEALVVEWDVDEGEVMQVSTVRLILQPLVENAFQHGYEEHDRKPEYLKISGRFTGDRVYVISLIDRGNGMTEATLQRMNRLFTDVTLGQMVREHQFQEKNIGLWNVHSRLRLTFGEPYGIYIRESGPNGTHMDIILPGRKRHV